MTGKIDLEPKNREDRDSCSPGELCCLCSYIPTWNGVGGFFGTVSLGSSTRLIQQPEKGRREQEVRDRLNGSLLINFRFFSPLPTLDAMQYTEEQQQQQRSHTYTGWPNVWVRWEVLEAWTIQCRLQSRFLFLYTCGAQWVELYWRGGIFYTAPRPMSRVLPFTKMREKERGGIRFKSLAWPILFPIRTTHRREMG